MRLHHLADVVWSYDLLHTVEPGTGSDGQVYGQGTAEFSGRLAGSATWANFPRVREGYAFPDARGSLTAEDGAIVLFTVTGVSSLADGSGVHVMTFRTDDPPRRWLNQVLALGEGSIDVAASRLSMRYYECLPEVPPDVG